MKKALFSYIICVFIISCNNFSGENSTGIFCYRIHSQIESLAKNRDSIPIVFFRGNFDTLRVRPSSYILNYEKYPFYLINNDKFSPKNEIFEAENHDFDSKFIDFCTYPAIIKFSFEKLDFNIDSLFKSTSIKIENGLSSQFVKIQCGYIFLLLDNKIYFILGNGCFTEMPFDSIREYLVQRNSKFLWVECGNVREKHM